MSEGTASPGMVQSPKEQVASAGSIQTGSVFSLLAGVVGQMYGTCHCLSCLAVSCLSHLINKLGDATLIQLRFSTGWRERDNGEGIKDKGEKH